ncbi:DUF5681 domain-containing protein [Mesorhizobium sp. RP14(2022)]|uniref:DUF5681 domain-containing protein n=1 Tax=Mesorhizobium liriopis TaxID=2953882 RepID=A0ABT1C968_9HYPH|nr:DUF5681 domain-containing protein [Mesorhizobium liriopis]MCO6050511.1 DUF5681 domain-containing protein [Mesorhizobium liriopis]
MRKTAIKDYAVGYGRPPEHTRFKPGQSGNSRGRPKKDATLRGAVLEELLRRRTVRIDGKEQRLTQLEIIAKQLVKQGMEGRSSALKELIKLEPAIFGAILGQAAPQPGTEGQTGDDASLNDTDLAMMRWLLLSHDVTVAKTDGEEGDPEQTSAEAVS